MQNRRQRYHVRNDVTRASIMAPLTVEDRLLIKALCIEKGWSVDCGISCQKVEMTHVDRQKINDVDHLKHVLISCRDTISQELINAAIDQWSKRLLLVIHSQDGHIEHRLH